MAAIADDVYGQGKFDPENVLDIRSILKSLIKTIVPNLAGLFEEHHLLRENWRLMLLGLITCLSCVLAISPSQKSGLALGFALASFFANAILHYSLQHFEPFSDKHSGWVGGHHPTPYHSLSLPTTPHDSSPLPTSRYRYRLLSPRSIPASLLAFIGLALFILSETHRESSPDRRSVGRTSNKILPMLVARANNSSCHPPPSSS